MDVEIEIDRLFENARKYYGKTTGFYITEKNIDGLHLGVFTPIGPFVWKSYVPESLDDIKTLSKEFEKDIRKSFYCDACAILEPDGVLIQNSCKNSKGFQIPPTENVALLVHQKIIENGIRFIICATAQQYYYNHLLFQTESHYSGYTLFEDFNLFTAMFSVLSNITSINNKIKMIFNGNFGSNRWHFHTHITDQVVGYVDEVKLQESLNRNATYGVVKFRVISNRNLQQLFRDLHIYTRFVYGSDAYVNGQSYISVIFKSSNSPHNNCTTCDMYYAFITTGQRHVFSGNDKVTLVQPSAMLNVSNIDTKITSEFLNKFTNQLKLAYVHLPDNPPEIHLPINTVEKLETNIIRIPNIEKYFTDNILPHIASCTINTSCNNNEKAVYKYLLSLYILLTFKQHLTPSTATQEQFVKVYRSLYKDNNFRKLVYLTSEEYMVTSNGKALGGGFDYLKGSVGSLLFTQPFNNFIMLSSNKNIPHNPVLNDYYALTPNINEWVRDDHKRIGDPSGNGIVLLNYLRLPIIQDNPLREERFIIKTSKYAQADQTYISDDQFLYETATGLKLNKLRERIPNFPLTFGGFDCVKGSGETSLCALVGEARSFVVLEFIAGKTFTHYIREQTEDNIVNTLLQIIIALGFAQKYEEFVHYDFHTSNVMISPLPDTSYYKYKAGNEYLTLKTDINCVIIDFGFARVKGVVYPKIVHDWGTDQNTFYSHRDLYTILMGTFIEFCASKSDSDIEHLVSNDSILGSIFRELFIAYKDTLKTSHQKAPFGDILIDIYNVKQAFLKQYGQQHYIADNLFPTIRNHMASYITRTIGQFDPQLQINVQVPGLILFLGKNHQAPNSWLNSPKTFIAHMKSLSISRRFFHNVDVNIPVYTWGDASLSDIGCQVIEHKPNTILINHVSTEIKKIKDAVVKM